MQTKPASDLKPLRLYLPINPADEPLQQPLSAKAYELTAFLRGLNQKDYAVEIFTLTAAQAGLFPSLQFPVLTSDTDILCAGILPTIDELSALLRLGCERVEEDSNCCSDVNPLREQAANLQDTQPDLAERLLMAGSAQSFGKPGVLFVCCHNSCRSQMAEAFLRQMAGDRFEVQSCGLTPCEIHPLTCAAMKEAGVELRGQTSKDYRAVTGRGCIRHAIFVCDVDEKECPRAFPFALHYHRHSFSDPAAAGGSHSEQMEAFRRVRDEIKAYTKILAKELR